MPIPVVAVELAAEDAASPAAAVLIETCSQAVRRGRCVVAGGKAPETEAPAAIAIVSWESPRYERVHIQVGVRGADAANWVTRDVTFGPGDPELERWRNAGLTIAILIGELPEARELMGEERPSGSADTPTSPTSAAPDAASPAPGPGANVVDRAPRDSRRQTPNESPHRAARGFVEGSGLFGSGLEHGAARRGGSLTAGYSLGIGPLLVPVRVSYAWRPEDETSLAVQWLAFAAGLGGAWSVGTTPLTLDARAFAALEQVTASAAHPTSGREDSAQRWIPALGLCAGPAYDLLGSVSVFAQGEVWRSYRRVTIYNADVAVARTRLWTGLGEVGVRLTFR